MSLTPSSGSESYDPLGSAALEAAAARLRDQSQLDFDLEFFDRILDREPEYIDVLRCQGELLSRKGLHDAALAADRRLVALLPADATARYNLACSLAVVGKTRAAITELRHALEAGYTDFELLSFDTDLDSLRDDPRFRSLLSEFGIESRES
jgi:tetratricopeptide (TPR) repeat protein